MTTYNDAAHAAPAIHRHQGRFQFNGIRLPDPNPNMTVDDVKAFYAAQYPELGTAVVNGPEAAGDKMRYTFDRAIGSKG